MVWRPSPRGRRRALCPGRCCARAATPSPPRCPPARDEVQTQEGSSMSEIPPIISVDDHVVEPPDLWTSRLPEKYRDRGPRIERKKVKLTWGGPFFELDAPDGEW